MELTYNELKKRDVINVVDGRSLGSITDIRLKFPEGRLVGIYVPGRRTNFFSRIFDKTSIYIDESRIIKIGGDVILVNLKGGEDCSGRIEHGKGKKGCPPPCPPPCPPSCPPPKAQHVGAEVDFSILSGGERIDMDDY